MNVLPLTLDPADECFVRGFEIGRIWTLLREREGEPVSEYIRSDQAELVLRLAEATDRSVRAEEIGDGERWLLCHFAADEDPLITDLTEEFKKPIDEGDAD